MLRFLGVVNWGSILPCVIFSLFGVVLGSSDVVTGRYVCCCVVRQQRCGLVSAIPREQGPVVDSARNDTTFNSITKPVN
jgi:hypothetical protein